MERPMRANEAPRGASRFSEGGAGSGSAEAIRGDASAKASGGRCASIAELLNRVTGIGHAAMVVGEDFDGSAQVYELGCLRVCHIGCHAPMTVDGRSAKAPEQHGLVHLLVPLAGEMTIDFAGRGGIALRADDWCVIARAGEFLVHTEGPVEFVALIIPAEELASARGAIHRLSERRVGSDTGAARLFLHVVRGLVAETPGLGAASRVSFGNAAIQALKAAAADLASSRRGLAAQEQLFRRACEIIESDLGNERLSVEHIARRLGCSKRYLHYLFARHLPGQTPARHIRRRRLARCRSELMMATGREKAIAQVAHRWGFHDPSHFARLFRREYGVAPSALGQGASRSD